MSDADKNFLAAADFIAARLCRDAVWAGGRCNWLGDSMEFVGGQWAVAHRAFGPDLYGGTSGVALFLAEAFRLTGERQFRTTAYGGLRQALSRVGAIDGPARVGFYTGRTGLAYALVRAGEIFDNGDFIERGLNVVEELTADEPDERALDVLSGGAGAIPALLALHKKYGRDSFLDLAVRHGNFLVAAARKTAAGWSWNTLNIEPERRREDLNGFSHGAGGIAWSLLELARATGEGKFRVAAEQGFRYERQHFNREHENWPDFRGLYDPWMAGAQGGAGGPTYMNAWCHGAPGIGLARLRAFALTGEDGYRQEAEAALRTTARALAQPVYPGQGNYSLCHGSCGNAELLLYASRLLGNEDYAEPARRLGREGIEQCQKTYAPWPCGVPNGGETPGLMLGLAGIGHFYLRLHDPAGVPPIVIILPD